MPEAEQETETTAVQQ